MSKILDALKRLDGGASELILPALEEPPATDPPAAPLCEEISTAEPAAPPYQPEYAPVSAPAREAEAAPAPEAPLSGVRTLPLRLGDTSPVLPFDETNWSAGEQYRMVRTKIIQHPRQPRMIVISSSGALDGKTLTATNLAGALALKTESKVLLLDADFRRSTVHSALGLPETPGLGDVLKGSCELDEALVHAEQLANLYVLSAGSSVANPAELLDSPRWVALCGKVRSLFRYIILDSPPITAVTDYDLIQASCDGVIVVVRPDHTKRALCLKTLAAVPQDKLLGVILNCVSPWFLGSSEPTSYYYLNNARDHA
jgi:capsular exopolysaccharide synthesis family protein